MGARTLSFGPSSGGFVVSCKIRRKKIGEHVNLVHEWVFDARRMTAKRVKGLRGRTASKITILGGAELATAGGLPPSKRAATRRKDQLFQILLGVCSRQLMTLGGNLILSPAPRNP